MQITEKEDEEKEEKKDGAGRACTRETAKTWNISNSMGESNTSERCSSFSAGAFRCSFTANFERNVAFPNEIIASMRSESKVT